jgi:hypothetical protein
LRNDVLHILTAYNIPLQLPTAPGSGTGLRVATPDFDGEQLRDPKVAHKSHERPNAQEA